VPRSSEHAIEWFKVLLCSFRILPQHLTDADNATQYPEGLENAHIHIMP
jgi:hypothetical protein